MKTLPAISEKEFQAQVRELATLYGWLVMCVHDSRRSPAGFPDLLMIRPAVGSARILVAELKVGKRRLTPAQVRWLEAFAAARVEAYCWHPEDFELIERTLRP